VEEMKVIVFDPSKCTGCRLCEIACSVKHEGISNPLFSRVKILKRYEEFFAPARCRQCEEPICLVACPLNAISRDKTLSIVKVDYDKCWGCRLCVELCPYGGIYIHPVKRKAAACDLCDGDPECVKVCSGEALSYVEEHDVVYKVKRENIFRLLTLK
jgi:Fe-S-cluster-containing hydrogenase component 2